MTTRGTGRTVIFGDRKAYGRYCDLLAELVERFGVRLHAYVLMPNHAHLVIETPQANLSAAMQWLSTSYSMWFNRRKGRVGPLFQGRYKAILFDGLRWIRLRRGCCWGVGRGWGGCGGC